MMPPGSSLLRHRCAAASYAIVSAAITLAMPAHAQDCTSYGDYIHEVGAVNAVGTATEVIMSGDHAYVAFGTSLWIVDVSVPTSPIEVARLEWPAFVFGRGLDLQGDHVYVARSDSVLIVVDVSDVTAPVVIGSAYTGSYGYDVEVSGSLAYVAAISGLHIVDVSIPLAPTLVGSVNSDDPFTDVAVQGDIACLIHAGNGWDSGMTIIDVGDPSSPWIRSVLPTPGDARDVVVSGGHAFVADDRRGLQVVTITNPAQPNIVATLDIEGEIKGCSIEADLIYLAAYYTGVHVIDVADPLDPELLSSVSLWAAYHVAVQGDVACVGLGAFGLSVLDIADPGPPPVIASVAETYSLQSVVIQGDRAYLTTKYRNDQCVSSLSRSFLRVVDLADPGQATVLGSVQTRGHPFDVAVEGDHAFVARGCRGLLAVDVSDPGSPATRGSMATVDSTVAVVVDDGHAYVANIEYDEWDYLGSLLVVDVSNPGVLSLVGVLETGNEPVVDVAVHDDIAYLVGWFGLKTVDVTTPQNPTVLGELGTPGSAAGIDVVGDHAYIACGSAGLFIADVSEPSTPFAVGSIDFGSSGMRQVAVRDGIAYVAMGSYGLQVVDVRDPYHPVYLGGYDTPGEARDVAVGSHVLIADEDSDLLVMLLECDSSVGVEPVQPAAASVPAVGRLRQNLPNPFRSTTRFSFSLPQDARVSVRIYDPVGRLVRTLVDGRRLGPGDHVHSWDGRRDDGRAVGAGIYFYELTTGTQRLTRRMVYLH